MLLGRASEVEVEILRDFRRATATHPCVLAISGGCEDGFESLDRDHGSSVGQDRPRYICRGPALSGRSGGAGPVRGGAYGLGSA